MIFSELTRLILRGNKVASCTKSDLEISTRRKMYGWSSPRLLPPLFVICEVVVFSISEQFILSCRKPEYRAVIFRAALLNHDFNPISYLPKLHFQFSDKQPTKHTMSLRRSALSCLRAALQRSHNSSGSCSSVVSSATNGLPPSAAALFRSSEYVTPIWSRVSAMQLTNLRGFSSAPRQQWARHQTQKKVSDQGMYLVRGLFDSANQHMRRLPKRIESAKQRSIDREILINSKSILFDHRPRKIY